MIRKVVDATWLNMTSRTHTLKPHVWHVERPNFKYDLWMLNCCFNKSTNQNRKREFCLGDPAFQHFKSIRWLWLHDPSCPNLHIVVDQYIAERARICKNADHVHAWWHARGTGTLATVRGKPKLPSPVEHCTMRTTIVWMFCGRLCATLAREAAGENGEKISGLQFWKLKSLQ